MSDWNTTDNQKPNSEYKSEPKELANTCGNAEPTEAEFVGIQAQGDEYLKLQQKQTKQQTKLQCLEAALRTPNANVSEETVLEAAKAYYDFVRR